MVHVKLLLYIAYTNVVTPYCTMHRHIVVSSSGTGSGGYTQLLIQKLRYTLL